MKILTLNIVRFYKRFITPALLPLLGPGCRQQPSCSEFCYSSVSKHGVTKGLKLSFFRLLRCNNFSTR